MVGWEYPFPRNAPDVTNPTAKPMRNNWEHPKPLPRPVKTVKRVIYRTRTRKPRRTPKNRVKTPSLRLLKKRLWQLCKELTRLHYGNTCFTCGAKNIQGSNWQTGHFLPSSVCSVEMRYSLDNLRPQCAACNIWKSGNWPAYELALEKEGIDTSELKRRNIHTVGQKYDFMWYKEKIAIYQKLLG